jgi:hypothetical protein
MNNNKNKFVILSSVLSLSILLLSTIVVSQQVDADSAKKKLKKIGKKMERLGDCSQYNSKMAIKAMKEGKVFHANPTCDEDDQAEYDELNRLEQQGNDDALIEKLKEKVYGKDDNSKFKMSNDDGDDDDDNSIHEKSKNTLDKINEGLKNLGR